MSPRHRAHEVSLRAAGADDRSLPGRALCLAADPDGPGLSVEEAAGPPELARYVRGWPQAGDVGVVAETPTGELVAAAWARLFAPEARGHGFVSPVVPELAMAVEPAWRGLGWGGAVLDGLLSALRTRGVGSVSLSVRDTNTAARALYDARGFVAVGRAGAEDTASAVMLLVL